MKKKIIKYALKSHNKQQIFLNIYDFFNIKKRRKKLNGLLALRTCQQHVTLCTISTI